MDAQIEDDDDIPIVVARKQSPQKIVPVAKQMENQQVVADPKAEEQRRLVLEAMSAKTGAEKMALVGRQQEKVLLDAMPSVEQLRREKSYHALDGRNRLNIRAKNVKMITDYGGEAVEVDFKGYINKTLINYLLTTGKAKLPQTTTASAKNKLVGNTQFEDD